jgi:hypothetical protein
MKTKTIPFNVDMEECEIITSMESMSYEDVVKGWMFVWIVMNFWFEPILRYIYYEYFKADVKIKDFFVKFQDFLENNPTSTTGILYNRLKNNVHNSYDDYDQVVDYNYSIEYFRENITLVLKDFENFISKYFNRSIDNLGVGYAMQ